MSTSNTGNSLTVDWVGRDLYWAEQKSENSNSIVKYDLNLPGSRPQIILSRITVVWKLDISPYRRYFNYFTTVTSLWLLPFFDAQVRNAWSVSRYYCMLHSKFKNYLNICHRLPLFHVCTLCRLYLEELLLQNICNNPEACFDILFSRQFIILD